jgi:quercetin dioxygenase-like cupin family protein
MNASMATGGPRRTVSCLGSEYTTLIGHHDSGGRIGMFESRVPPGEGPPAHVHHNEDEVIHVLEGQYEFWLDGTTRRVGPGHAMFLPRDVPHTFRVLGSTPGRSIGTVTPGGFESFFGEVAARDLRIPRDMDALAALAARYRIEFLGQVRWAA